MCSVTIVFAHDGKNIQSDICQKLYKQDINTRTVSLQKSTSWSSDANKDVLAIILTPQMCNDIVSEDANVTPSVIKTPSNTLILCACPVIDKARVVQVLSQNDTSFGDVEMVDVEKKGGLNSAVANIVTMVESMGSSAQGHKPLVNKYVLEPERVTSLDEDIAIVLLESRANVSNVTARIEADDVHLPAIKIKNDVWKIPTSHIKPGDKTVHVFADGEDLGPATLVKEAGLDTVTVLLPRVVTDQPLDLLARLLNCDVDTVDRELNDILSVYGFGDTDTYGPFVRLLETLLQFGCKPDADGETKQYPSLLHFCAHHGLETTCLWLLKYSQHGKQAVSQCNRDNKTPVQLAEINGFCALAKKLDTHYDDSVFVPPTYGAAPSQPARPRRLSLNAVTPPGTGPYRQADSGMRSSFDTTGSSNDSIGSRGSGENIRRPQRGRLPSDATTNCLTAMLSDGIESPDFRDTSPDSRLTAPPHLMHPHPEHEAIGPHWQTTRPNHTYDDINDEEGDVRYRHNSTSDHYNAAWDGEQQTRLSTTQRKTSTHM